MSSSNPSILNANVRVVARVRPPPNPESGGCIHVSEDSGTRGLTIRDPKSKNDVDREFALDRVFGPTTTQFSLYDELVQPSVEHVLEGYNACCFAYGQTGSGKTYSMIGERGDVRGMIPRAMESLFKAVAHEKRQRKFVIWVSFLEVYLDQVRDLGRYYLLKNPGKASQRASSRASSSRSRPGSAASHREPSYENENLTLKEAADGRVYVRDLSEIPISSLEDVQAIIREGVLHRETHETAMNPVSSRSHTVFTVTVTSHNIKDPNSDVITGTLNLVDLAGSERLHKTNSEGKRLQEAKTINKSLAALGNVVVSLVQGVPHVPYRNSKLTRLLQGSLGGNSFTTVLVTLNPDPAEYEESLNTLQFAFRCRHVQNQPKVNYIDTTVQMQEKRIKKLLSEIADLNAEVTSLKQQAHKQGIDRESSRMEVAESSGDLTALGSVTGGDAGYVSTSTRSLQGLKLQKERRLAEERHRETTRVLESVAQDKRHLQEKIKKKSEAFRAVQERVRDNQDKHVRQVDQMRQKIAELTNALEVSKQDFVHMMNAKAKEHEDELNQVAVNNQRIMKENLTQLQSMMKNAKVSSEDRVNVATAVGKAKKEVEEEWKERVQEMNEHFEATRNDNKKKYEFFLESKARELRNAKKHSARQAQAYEEEISELKEENSYLHALVDDYDEVMTNLEQGKYPMRERNGMKGFQLPKNIHKAMDPSRLPFSRRIGTKKFKNLRKLLDEAEAQKQATLNFTGTERLPSARGPNPPTSARPPTRSATVTPRAASRGAHLNESLGSHRSNSDVFEADLSMMSKDDLRTLVDEMRQRLQSTQPLRLGGEEKKRVREEVLSDLADHQLISYIRELETERDRYFKLTKDERARSNALRVALEARERLLAKRPTTGTATLRGLSSTSRPSTSRSGFSSVGSHRSSSRPRTSHHTQRSRSVVSGVPAK